MTTNNSVNAPFPLSSAQGGLGVASPTAHGILIGEGSSPVNNVVLALHALLVGQTTADPAAYTLVNGTNITITYDDVGKTITFAAASSGTTWNDTTGGSATLAPLNGYIADSASLTTFTLPATAAVGDTYIILGKGAGGWTVAQNSGQTVHLGNVNTTAGVGGSLSSSNQWDSLKITCVTANTTFTAYAITGNITYV